MCYFKIFNLAGMCESSLLLFIFEICIFISFFNSFLNILNIFFNGVVFLLGDLGLGGSSGIICRHIASCSLLLLRDFDAGVAIALVGGLEPFPGCSGFTGGSGLDIINKLAELCSLIEHLVDILLLEFAGLLEHSNIVGKRPDSILEVDEIEDHVRKD